MFTKDNLNKAIGSHGIWKSRLRSAITTGQLDIAVSEIQDEGQCEFGKWLLGTGMRAVISNGHGKQIRELHAEFHRSAARIAELALAGKKKEAENSMANDGAFCQVSTKLTLALMNLRDSL